MKRMQRALALALLVSLAPHALGCGTILYPERRGQAAGRLDVAVVILDAIGLLFFLVPGVVAFAVDFATGTIYLPGGRRAGPVERIPFDGHDFAAATAAVEARTGLTLADRTILVARAEGAEDPGLQLARLLEQLDGAAPGPTQAQLSGASSELRWRQVAPAR